MRMILMVDQLLNWASNLSTFAAAFAVLWGVYEFLKKNKEESEQRRSENVRQWREARAHYEFEKAGPSGLNFMEYQEKMQSSAFGKEGDKVDQNELNEEELRLVLISLIERKTIEPFGESGSRYRVQSASSTNDVLANNTEALPYIMELIRTKSGQYTDAGIVGKLNKFAIGEVQMRAILLQMYQYGLIFQDDEGKWHLNNTQGQFPSVGNLKQLSQHMAILSKRIEILENERASSNN